MSTQENIRRLSKISSRAESEGVGGAEYVRRIIRKTVLAGNPFVNPGDDFIVLGVDGFDGSIFPCGSFNTLEDAELLVRTKTGEEHLFSDSEDISTTFHVFSKDGFHIPPEEPPNI
ncbi:MAG: hypothetical protein A3C30_00215 [Candidatus Levybacteria bacterium RIFCSPHIGHO2_02_FULL_40_18]|nr:MAG: hypothetical protein A2869_03910 [Candidatus Levybacteria bacterium RIFCSPHIGHO2_01_FULL_40_58]OGH27127.1 MAG: hypothetical protein A3C30_00215 [Candidatus Levybacteria bacterium RIFCSPHIGHO2_02_FULL_40_18]OGH30986.1 MAG: hypothetical protein A3E43_04630 [Candidatus Levybacteria bacterium RIFCSPHIGHO2_12_FULL_40_31]OGH40997.1 MAG: hypothetical protein A2894_01845 [Candidatus Levybacteria bacterium RIFCSPLOWO2_01_FULL_40_64]OGH48926.1 MAG: hypothetical protein A3I54_02710 [Candidatus Lev